MRRFKELLDEANGADHTAQLDAIRARRGNEGERSHYAKVLEVQLGDVASDKLVVRRPAAAHEARAEARTITEEHQIAPPAEAVRH